MPIDGQKSRGFALVIGIQKHLPRQSNGDPKPDFPDLNFAANDAEDFAEFLRGADNLIQYDVRQLVNDQASCINIRKQLARLRRDVQILKAQEPGGPDPLVIVYFSGHGWTDGEGRHYLIPFDAEQDQLRATALLNREFSDYLDEIETNRLVVFLDACHAGAMLEPEIPGPAGQMKGPGTPQPQYALDDIGGQAGRYLIASCGPNQRSYEWNARQNGIFTSHLVDLLTCQTDDFNNEPSPEIDLTVLFEHLSRKVSATIEQLKNDLKGNQKEEPVQIPLKKFGGDERIVLAVNPKVEAENLSKQAKKIPFLSRLLAAELERPLGRGKASDSEALPRLQRHLEEKENKPNLASFYRAFEAQFERSLEEGDQYSCDNGLEILYGAYSLALRQAPSPRQASNEPQQVSPEAPKNTQDTLSTPPRMVSARPVSAPVSSGRGNLLYVQTQAAKNENVEPRTRVFFSYVHEERAYLEALVEMLAPKSSNIDVWYDTQIKAGDQWSDRIDSMLATSCVAVLMVSKLFLNSDFILTRELPAIVKAAEEKALTLIWILVDTCNWKDSSFVKFQAALHEKPLDRMEKNEREDAMLSLCGKITDAYRAKRGAGSQDPDPK